MPRMPLLTVWPMTCFVLGATAWGHPGHGSTDPDSSAHYLIEVPHALWLIPVLAVCGLLLHRLVSPAVARQVARRKPDDRRE